MKMHICDTESSCEFFVRVFIDDNKVFTSSRKTDESTPSFKETYISEIIPRHSRVRFELWDDDAFFNGGPDIQLVADSAAESLNGFKRFSNNDVALEIFCYINDPKLKPFT